MSGTRIYPEVLRSIDSATFTGSFQALGGVLINPAVLVKIVNNSTVNVTVSWDGVNDHDFIPANSFALYDVSTNHGQYNLLSIRSGIQFYVKGSAGSESVYFTVLYIQEN